jgi:hypothetical protein
MIMVNRLLVATDIPERNVHGTPPIGIGAKVSGFVDGGPRL